MWSQLVVDLLWGSRVKLRFFICSQTHIALSFTRKRKCLGTYSTTEEVASGYACKLVRVLYYLSSPMIIQKSCVRKPYSLVLYSRNHSPFESQTRVTWFRVQVITSFHSLYYSVHFSMYISTHMALLLLSIKTIEFSRAENRILNWTMAKWPGDWSPAFVIISPAHRYA